MSGYVPPSSTPSVALESQAFFHGLLSGVRIWSDALNEASLPSGNSRSKVDNESGLISAWWFREQIGTTVEDSASGNDATLSSEDLWVLFEPLSNVQYYANGYLVTSVDPISKTQSEGYPHATTPQFTIAGYNDDSGSLNQGFIGKPRN